MTTRSGLNYRNSGEMSETGHTQASATETEVTGDVQKVLQMRLEDRHKHEEKAKRRLLERQERETERRLQEMQKHVAALLKVVEKSHEETSGIKKVWSADDDKEVKLTKLSDSNDVEPTSPLLSG